jgi:hypothetical protein
VAGVDDLAAVDGEKHLVGGSWHSWVAEDRRVVGPLPVSEHHAEQGVHHSPLAVGERQFDDGDVDIVSLAVDVFRVVVGVVDVLST